MYSNKNNHASNSTQEDTPPPLDDMKMQDLSDASFRDDDDNGSFSDYEDEHVENLQQVAAKNTRKNLARSETKAVSCLRYVVLSVLLATAIGVSVATYMYSRRVEQRSFSSEFEGVAATTLRSFAEAVEHRLAAMDVLATGITSYALDSGEVFPNVTVPDWEVKGGQLRTQTDGIYSFFLPLVTDETRAGYEAYCKVKQGQLFQGYVAEESMRVYQDKLFGIEEEETTAADSAAEEATTEEEAKLEHSHEDGEDHDHVHRQLHAAPPEIHPEIHEGIWGLNVCHVAGFFIVEHAPRGYSHSPLFFPISSIMGLG